MIIARIIGTVVASQKDERLEGEKLLIVRAGNWNSGRDGQEPFVVRAETAGYSISQQESIASSQAFGGYRCCGSRSRRVGFLVPGKRSELSFQARGDAE